MTDPFVAPTLVEIRAALHSALGELSGIEAVALFGSYARGQARVESDIDVLVLLREGQEPRLVQEACLSAEAVLDCQVSPLVFECDEVCRRIKRCDPQLGEIFRQAKPLLGRLPDFPGVLPPAPPAKGSLPEGILPLGRAASAFKIHNCLNSAARALRDAHVKELSSFGAVGAIGDAAVSLGRAVLELTGRRAKNATDYQVIRCGIEELPLSPGETRSLEEFIEILVTFRRLDAPPIPPETLRGLLCGVRLFDAKVRGWLRATRPDLVESPFA